MKIRLKKCHGNLFVKIYGFGGNNIKVDGHQFSILKLKIIIKINQDKQYVKI